MTIIMIHTLQYILSEADKGDLQAIGRFESIQERLFKIEGKKFLTIQDEQVLA